jgi:hypothetical protein
MELIEAIKEGLAGFCAFLIIPASVALWVVLAVAIDDLKKYLKTKI